MDIPLDCRLFFLGRTMGRALRVFRIRLPCGIRCIYVCRRFRFRRGKRSGAFRCLGAPVLRTAARRSKARDGIVRPAALLHEHQIPVAVYHCLVVLVHLQPVWIVVSKDVVVFDKFQHGGVERFQKTIAQVSSLARDHWRLAWA